MAYVKKTLAPGEEYLYRAKFNWTYDFTSWFWLAVGLIPAGIWTYALLNENLYADALTRSFIVTGAIAFIAGLLIWLSRHIYKWTTVIAVTSARLILKQGLIARDSHEVSLDEVEEVFVHQSFLGRILGYGELTVRGTGVAVIEFPILARPMEIRREIDAAVIRARGINMEKAAET